VVTGRMVSVWCNNGRVEDVCFFGRGRGDRFYKFYHGSRRTDRDFVRLLGIPCRTTAQLLEDGSIETRHVWYLVSGQEGKGESI
jgi:hypothetical protein